MDHAMISSPHGPLRVGIGGPVGTGKTTLTAALCRHMAAATDMCVITNDIYTREDAEALIEKRFGVAELPVRLPAVDGIVARIGLLLERVFLAVEVDAEVVG